MDVARNHVIHFVVREMAFFSPEREFRILFKAKRNYFSAPSCTEGELMTAFGPQTFVLFRREMASFESPISGDPTMASNIISRRPHARAT